MASPLHTRDFILLFAKANGSIFSTPETFSVLRFFVPSNAPAATVFISDGIPKVSLPAPSAYAISVSPFLLQRYVPSEETLK